MRFKIVSLIAVAGLVAACGTAPTTETSTMSGEGQATAAAPSSMSMTSQEQLHKVGDRVFFGFDKYDLTADARTYLNKQAAWLKANGSLNVTIEGHCDERGTREYNLALGERRATAVADYLMTLGIASYRINTISYGKERPAFAASTEAAWAQNRRSVTVVR